MEINGMEMKINGMEIKLTEDGAYRPKTVIINGELASMDAFLKVHRYCWEPTASGNKLYYRTETGKEYTIYQGELKMRAYKLQKQGDK